MIEMRTGARWFRAAGALAAFLFWYPCFAQAPAGHARLFVADSAGGGISAIDPSGGKVLFSIPSPAPVEFAALSPDARSLYLANSSRNALQMADIRALKVTRGAELQGKPACLAVSPDGRRVFVCLAGDSAIDVVDTAPMRRERSIFTGVVGPVRGLFLTPDTTRMVAAGAKGLAVINVRSEKIEFTIPTPVASAAVAFDSDSHLVIRRLFVIGEGAKAVEVIDYPERKSAGQLATGAPPTGLAVTADRKGLWVVAGDAAQGFSLPELKKTASIPLEPGAKTIACAGDSPRCFVSNPVTGTVTILDTGNATTNAKELSRARAGKAPSVLLPEPVQPEATHSPGR